MQRREAMGQLAIWGLLGGWGLKARAQQRVTVHGAGATFPAKVYGTWGTAFAKTHNVDFQYDAVGSGKGVDAMRAGQVDFGASDVALTPAQLSQAGWVQVPMVIGGLVPVVHPDVGRGLVLNAEVLAGIYLGQITHWNAPAIQALNPSARLPARPIQRVVRADKSGSTQGFVEYLGTHNPAFRTADLNSQLPKWPGTPIKAEGSGGVLKTVAQTPGAIGYVGQDYLGQGGVHAVQLHSAEANPVEPTRRNFQTAMLARNFGKTDDDTVSLIAAPSRTAWPITLTTFILLPQRLRNDAGSLGAARFVYWALNRGDNLASAETFAPLPVTVQARMAGRLATITTANNQKTHLQSLTSTPLRG